MGGAAVGGVGSLEDLPTACALLKVPSQSSLTADSAPSQSSLTADSDSDMHNSVNSNKSPGQKGAESSGTKISTDSDPLSDDYTVIPMSSSTAAGATAAAGAGAGKKTVAINTAQVEHFTHRLLPVQSPEFDNVMDQVSHTVTIGIAGKEGGRIQ